MWCPVRRRTPYEALGAVCNLNPLPPRSGGARGGAYPLKCKHALGGVAINLARIVKARIMRAFFVRTAQAPLSANIALATNTAFSTFGKPRYGTQ